MNQECKFYWRSTNENEYCNTASRSATHAYNYVDLPLIRRASSRATLGSIVGLFCMICIANTTTGLVLSPLRFWPFKLNIAAEAGDDDKVAPIHTELDKFEAGCDTRPKFTRSLISTCCLDSVTPEVVGIAIVIAEGSVAPAREFAFSSFMLWRRPVMQNCCVAPAATALEVFIDMAGRLAPERENELGELPLLRRPVILFTVCCW